MRFRLRRTDAMRSALAGSAGASLRDAGRALYDAGGNKVLPMAAQRVVRSALEREAYRLLAGAGMLEPGASVAGRLLERAGTRSVAVQGVRAAGKQMIRTVGGAAAAGALLDGGLATVQAVARVRAGTMSQGQAVAHVAREAGTGAAATAAGAVAAAALVAMTGGIAAPAVFVVAAAASLGAKMGLDAWLRSRAAGAIRAQLHPTA